MTYLVTGAGGFVGLALLDHLLSGGETVRAFNDRPLAPEALAHFATLPGRLEPRYVSTGQRATDV